MEWLSERQQKARRLAAWIEKLGGFVVSPLPLANGYRLRFQLLDVDRPRVFQALRDENWEPILCGSNMRVFHDGMRFVVNVEVDVPGETRVASTDRPFGEIAAPEKTDLEREGIKKYLGLK